MGRATPKTDPVIHTDLELQTSVMATLSLTVLNSYGALRPSTGLSCVGTHLLPLTLERRGSKPYTAENLIRRHLGVSKNTHDDVD